MAILWDLVNSRNLNPVGAFTQGMQTREHMDQRNARRSILSQLAGGGDYSAAANQLVRAGDLDGASTLAKMAQLGQREVPNSVREFEYGQQNPAFRDYQIGLKRAGSTNVNVNNKMESEYDKTVGKGFADQNFDIIKAAQTARGKIATLDRLGQLLSDPNIYTGAGANLVTDAKRMAKAIGIDVGDIGGAEAVRAIGNQFALELRNPAGGAGMPGALSDKDREFLQASVPGLQQTPEGNKTIIDYMKRVASRSIEVDKLRRDYIARNRRLDEGFYQELARYSEANPLFPEAQQGTATRQQRQQSYPDGTIADGPNGPIIRQNGRWVPYK